MRSKNKFSWQGKPEEDLPGDDRPTDKVMFGGCGVFYGPIRGPATARPKHSGRTFWSLLGFGWKEKNVENA